MSATKYDYIIAGAGCAGLSLLVHMLRHPFFKGRQILVVDHAPKTSNDRTWCFWEKRAGMFEPVVCKSWKQLHFYSNYFSSPVDIAPYAYKMIRGADFYQYAYQQAAQNPGVHFLYGKIEACGSEYGLGYATVDGIKHYAGYVFNSILTTQMQQAFFGQRNALPGVTTLLQHFKGWMIETQEHIFDSSTATFMDFRVHQQQGAAFVYVLPVAANKALVEYTFVTKQVLPLQVYHEGLKDYISQYITRGPYTVTEEEFGIIPMTDYRFSPGEGNVMNIGTAGAQTKGSSGITFNFIQKHSQAIVNQLVQGKHPRVAPSVLQKRFRLYDSILLNVLSAGKMPADMVFARLFKNIPPKTILRFLDNESSFTEELRIMASMPAAIFLPLAIGQIIGKRKV